MPERLTSNPAEQNTRPTLEDHLKKRVPELSRGTYAMGRNEDFLPENYAKELAELEYKRQILGEELTTEETAREHTIWLIKAGFSEEFATEYATLTFESEEAGGINNLPPDKAQRLNELSKKIK